MSTPHHHNEIIYISAEINGIISKVMIDTGSNVSLIDSTELERIQDKCRTILPTLPVHNLILIVAMGRQNKSVKKQVSVDLRSKGVIIPVAFLVASGLPFSMLIGCYVLRQRSAIIDLSRGIVSLTSEDGI